ncbi:MAG: glucose 1-dehydrogenase [Alphaproteobacteria bacterium]|jgi:3-oxoacyl-[acyl-carrier protein] reductase|nr:glucose 1-dehydrogenase [Alphaproteobacteria bacterium]MDP6517162.1 glucose 1-dehydrogenase [Alphaproteobacteria bacterium]
MSAPPYRLDGKVALVTGASRGLGRRFAQTLAGAGARVAATGRATELLDGLVGEIGEAGGTARAFPLDVTEAAGVRAAVAAVEETLGPIGILVNNSGIAITKPFLKFEESDWDRVMDTNLKGAWLVAREVAERMVAHARGGKIINIASIGASVALGQLSAYCVSKAGIAHLTRTMAVELARYDIQVNAIAPGYVETDMNRDFFATSGGKDLIRRAVPQRRLGQPEDLDGALMLLASDASRFMTGSIIAVDGGHSIA